MYGDYEAQRHWQEITYNLPPIQWYVHNDKKNNLTYWGLDYPPLTAFHSYFNGWVADRVLGRFEWVELGSSRGVGSRRTNEDDNSDPSFNPYFSNHKIFMRATVLFIDLIIFIFSSKLISDAFSNYKKANFILLANLPFLLMIDYAHFQYNCVSLGLFIGSLYCFLPREIMNSNDSSDHDVSENSLLKHKITDSKAILGAFLFMSSILYKQMNLYYSLPIFFYLLSKIIQNTLNKEHAAGFWLFFCLSTGVILSLGISFLPWLLPQDGKLLSQPGLLSKHDTVLLRLKQIFERVFPVGRGIFEDKVASFWCTINNVIKIKQIFDSTWLFRMALGATLGLAVPVCLHMAFVLIYCHESTLKTFKSKTLTNKSDLNLLRYALINVSLIFFLFSYHVHEKTILIVGIPIFLNVGYDVIPDLAFWFSDVAMFSLLPLFMREENVLQGLGCQMAFVGVRLLLFQEQGTRSEDRDRSSSNTSINSTNSTTSLSDIQIKTSSSSSNSQSISTKIVTSFRHLSNISMMVISIYTVFNPKPIARYPDLLEVLISSLSCLHFLLFLVIFGMLQVNEGMVMVGEVRKNLGKLNLKKKQ